MSSSGASFYVNPTVGIYQKQSDHARVIPFLYFQDGGTGTKDNVCATNFTAATNMIFMPSGYVSSNGDYEELSNYLPFFKEVDPLFNDRFGCYRNRVCVNYCKVTLNFMDLWTEVAQTKVAVSPMYGLYDDLNDIPGHSLGDADIWGYTMIGQGVKSVTILMTHPKPQDNVPDMDASFDSDGLFNEEYLYYFPYQGGVKSVADGPWDSTIYPFALYGRIARYSTAINEPAGKIFVEIDVEINFDITQSAMIFGDEQFHDDAVLRFHCTEALTLYQENPWHVAVGNNVSIHTRMGLVTEWIEKVIRSSEVAKSALFGKEKYKMMNFLVQLLAKVKPEY